MRSAISIIFGILLSTITIAQNRNFNPPKKASAVVVLKKDSAITFLTDYAKHLQNFGFSIERFDKELASLSTDFKTYKFGGVAVIKIVAFAQQNGETAKITIRGKIKVSTGIRGDVPYEACNCGMSGDARKNGFFEILKTLNNFNHEDFAFLIDQ